MNQELDSNEVLVKRYDSGIVYIDEDGFEGWYIDDWDGPYESLEMAESAVSSYLYDE